MAKKRKPSKPSKKPEPAKPRERGRPEGTGFKPSDRDRKDVEIAAAIGIPQEDMRLLITNPTSGKPISEKTLRKVFADELRLGMTRAKLSGGANLLALTKTSAAAAIFFAKVRLGMKEPRIDIRHSGKVQTGPVLTEEQMERRILQLLAKGKGRQSGQRQPRRDRGKP